MNAFSHVPPGFRFHPTDEELVDYYLRKKVTSRIIDLDVIKDVDLYKIEPWDLQELCSLGIEEQSEWYFFSHKDKKYPTGTRTNRATAAGFWKATGRDKAIYSKHDLIGMRKTLVFYKGRAPNGLKSDWIMHEYRLETDENGSPQEEGWVVCRVFKKRITTMMKSSEHESPCWYDDHQLSFMQDLEYYSPNPNSQHTKNLANDHLPYGLKKELDHHHLHNYQVPEEVHFLQQLPLLDQSPKLIMQTAANVNCNPMAAASSLTQEQHLQQNFQFFGRDHNNKEQITTDWRVLDKFVASQLSQEDSNAANNNISRANDDTNVLVRQLNKQEMMQENASTSTS